MNWERADRAEIDDKARYLVLTNGAEWRDNDAELWHGLMVKRRLLPEYVRGRPVWIMKIVVPTEGGTK